jgi:2',3'-cyclic-nucleotide 2'-phosphodiesterase (5'-nucleotidase family)
MKELRENEKGILVLDAGDLLFEKSLNPIPENEVNGITQKTHLIIESFNRMGYDALGIGDDDLTFGKEFLIELSKKANFSFLSSNLINEESGKPFFQLYLIKEINHLRIGIFSLISPDSFWSTPDPRRKGIIFRSPLETAQNMVKELQPKTDLIILLSHLGYSKDVELAQAVPGIHFIVSGHGGSNLYYPPLIKNTLILQMAPKGMYVGRFDLTLYNKEPAIYNTMTKRSLENNLANLKNRLASVQAPEAEKAQWRRAKEGIERTLQQFQGKNEFNNRILPLNEQIKDHPDIKKMVDEYRSKFPKTTKPVSPQ